jgi:hypothetical protein
MFTKAEEALIQELKEQKAPLERWAKFFPQHKIVDLMEKPKEAKPLYYIFGKPVYAGGVVHDSVTYIVGEVPPQSFRFNPCNEIPRDPEAYARSMKKGNIYMWDDLQDAYLIELARKAYTTAEIIFLLEKRFGIKRPQVSIANRLTTLYYY